MALGAGDPTRPRHSTEKPDHLNTKGVPAVFNYYADVFYAEDYETTFDSYYESEGNAVVKEENLKKVAGDLAAPTPANSAERRFLEEFERKMRMAPAPEEPADIDASPAAQEAAQLEIASWLPKRVKEAIIKKAAMEAYYFLFDKEYSRPRTARSSGCARNCVAACWASCAKHRKGARGSCW
jgi:hypothetical protein